MIPRWVSELKVSNFIDWDQQIREWFGYPRKIRGKCLITSEKCSTENIKLNFHGFLLPKCSENLQNFVRFIHGYSGAVPWRYYPQKCLQISMEICQSSLEIVQPGYPEVFTTEHQETRLIRTSLPSRVSYIVNIEILITPVGLPRLAH